MLRNVLVFSLICGMPAAAQQASESGPKTVAELLGFGPKERLLIIHADDAGMCRAHNRATIDGMEKGVINSASIMMPCAWVPDIVAYCKENPEADFGLHMTLCSEWKHYRWGPVAPRDQVKGLVDEEGYLWGDNEPVATHATAAEVETELRAQVKRAYALGLKPTHLDTHMGTVYARPDYFGAYRKVANEFGLPYMLPRISPELLDRLSPAFRVFAKQMMVAMFKKGEMTLDHLDGGYSGRGSYEDQKKYYMDAIRNLKPGITQIILHPAYDGEELKSITGSHVRRDRDVRVFMDPDVAKLIKDEKVRLITWREIGERQAKLRARLEKANQAASADGS